MIDETQARAALRALLEEYNGFSPDRLKQFTEADVVHQFLDPLFRDVLGWPIRDNDRYKYELSTKSGRPDMTLIPEGGAGTIFVEAKKFGVIKRLEQARNTIAGTITPGQMALPGMSIDRTEEEQQAINYAFENGGGWAILANFEVLRLFNARRDWLVLSFETPRALLDDFDLLWQLAYPNILNGSLDALSNQRHTEEVDSAYLEFINEWREKLARDALSLPKANDWLRRPDGTIDLPLLRDAVQRFIDRLVVIRFAEDHLVIPSGTLYAMYESRRGNIYTYSLYEFIRELFTNFDQVHNSALFAKTALDEIAFSTETLEALVVRLYAARYRAMPADILGNTYEQYLGKALTLDGGLVITRDNLETRKKQGSYYTPQVIVRYIVDQSLGRWLYGTENGRPDGAPIPGERRKTADDLDDLRVLDAACGSGSFLIYAYYVLADFYERERARLEAELLARKRELAQARLLPTEIVGDATVIYLNVAIERLADTPRRILEQHLYGVDLDPQAAEIAVVNLMMRAMERRRREKRLPLILNQNVKVGNALVGQRPDDPRLDAHAAEIADLIRQRQLLTTDPDYLTREQRDGMATESGERFIAGLDAEARLQYARALRHQFSVYEPLTEEELYPTYTGVRNKTAALAANFDPDYAAHFADIERARPFHWAVEFPEVFFNPDGTRKANGGFTVVFGNPPWEIVMAEEREFYAQFDARVESQLQGNAAIQRIAQLDAEDPNRRVIYEEHKQVIEQTAQWVHNSGEYKHQGTGHVATHKLFLERAYNHLLAQSGRLGFIIPSGIYTDQGTKTLRELFFNSGKVEYLYGLANVRGLFPEVDSRFKFTLLGVVKGGVTTQFPTLFLLSHAQWPPIERHPETNVIVRDGAMILGDILSDRSRLFTMDVTTIQRFSPENLTIMEFQSHQDYEISAKMYQQPLLGDEQTWQIKFAQELNLTTDNGLFNTPDATAPLYEGKMIHQYNAFYETPRYLVNQANAAKRVLGKTGSSHQRARLAFRDVARSTDERTVISAILPPNVFAGHTAIVEVMTDASEMLFLCAMFNSFCFDWLARFKVGTHVTYSIMKSLPLPRLTAGDPIFDAIVARAARLVCTRPEYDALWAAVMGDAPRAPLADAERERLRDEIDALAARLYGLSRDEFAHILTTFPLVFPETGAGAARRAALLAAHDHTAHR